VLETHEAPPSRGEHDLTFEVIGGGHRSEPSCPGWKGEPARREATSAEMRSCQARLRRLWFRFQSGRALLT
jgi:hypothetical protein